MVYKKIGIVSGMGAAAGARMLSLLIKECQRRGAKLDRDFPEIILHNMPSEGLNNEGISDSVKFLNELAHSIKLLNSCGVEVIMIACNTAHLFYDELQRNSKAKILNMVEIACEELEGKSVAVLSSRTTRDTSLYTTALINKGVKKILEADEATQNELDMIIENVIAGNDCRVDDFIMHGIVDRCEIECDVVILGCTELTEIIIGECIDPMRKVIEKVLE